MPDPATSFVIPAHNVARFIGETLSGLLSDPRPDIEVVVVDDGSTDGTAEVVGAIADPRLVLVRQQNAGVSAARNFGATRSRGDFLVFLDGDDLFDIAALDRLVEPLRRDPAVVASYGTFAGFVDGAAAALPRNPLRRLRVRPSGDVLRALLEENIVGAIGACCIRRTAFERTRGFDPALRMAEDWDLYCRLAALGPFVHVPGPPLMFYRQHPASASATLSPDTSRYDAFSRTLFGHPEIAARIGPDELARLRASNLASYRAFTAMKAVQAGDLPGSARTLWSALRACPRRGLELAGRYGWAVAQHFLFGGARGR